MSYERLYYRNLAVTESVAENSVGTHRDAVKFVVA